MPELAGFILFIRNTMGVKAKELPDDAPSITTSYALSIDWVNRQIACISPVLYAQAVYNLRRLSSSTSVQRMFSVSCVIPLASITLPRGDQCLC